MKILGQSWNGLLFQEENFTLTPVMLHPMIIIQWIASEMKGQHIQAGFLPKLAIFKILGHCMGAQGKALEHRVESQRHEFTG